MTGAWAGPLYWIQWAGGHRRGSIPAGGGTVRGGRTSPPGLARPLCVARDLHGARAKFASVGDLAETGGFSR
jgi:hypothetical protein